MKITTLKKKLLNTLTFLYILIVYTDIEYRERIRGLLNCSSISPWNTSYNIYLLISSKSNDVRRNNTK